MAEYITQIKLKFSFSKNSHLPQFFQWLKTGLFAIILLGLLNSSVAAQANNNADTTKNIFAEPDERDAAFPGGLTGFSDFINKNMHYQRNAKGRVIVAFIVETDGSLTDIRVVRSMHDDAANKEALRIIGLSPKWKPETQNGKPVRQQYIIPVTFPAAK